MIGLIILIALALPVTLIAIACLLKDDDSVRRDAVLDAEVRIHLHEVRTRLDASRTKTEIRRTAAQLRQELGRELRTEELTEPATKDWR
jgi:hypothetical protein